MLQVYTDDSGDAGSIAAFMAGFLSSADRWAAFSDAWKSVLDEKPVLEYFKMSEAASRKGQFYGWSKERCKERLTRLVEVTLNYVDLGIVTSIKTSDYKSIWKHRFNKGSDSLHFLLFHGIIARVVYHQLSFNDLQPVEFIFDEQGKESTKALEEWDRILSYRDPAVRSILKSRPMHRSDKDVLPLQAADMFAWMQDRRFHSKNQEDVSKTGPLSKLSEIPVIIRPYTASDLREIVGELKELGHTRTVS